MDNVWDPPRTIACPPFDEEVLMDYLGRVEAQGEKVLAGFLEGLGTRVTWPVVRAARLKRVWLDFGRTKVCRHSKAMHLIADHVMDCLARLHWSTLMSGHTSQDPGQYLEHTHGLEWDAAQLSRLQDYLVDARGAWLLSDHGLPAAEKWYPAIWHASTDEDRLLAVDKVLLVIHPRSDFAAFFVEGGNRTLAEIAAQL